MASVGKYTMPWIIDRVISRASADKFLARVGGGGGAGDGVLEGREGGLLILKNTSANAAHPLAVTPLLSLGVLSGPLFFFFALSSYSTPSSVPTGSDGVGGRGFTPARLRGTRRPLSREQSCFCFLSFFRTWPTRRGSLGQGPPILG